MEIDLDEGLGFAPPRSCPVYGYLLTLNLFIIWLSIMASSIEGMSTL